MFRLEVLYTYSGGYGCNTKNFIYAVIDNIGRFYDITNVNQGKTFPFSAEKQHFISRLVARGQNTTHFSIH